MTSPIQLIAEREFKTYVATVSFWAALTLGPLAAGGGLLLAQTVHHPASMMVQVTGGSAEMTKAVETALREAATIDGRPIRFGQEGVRLTISASKADHLDLNFAPGFPLSNAGRQLVARTLERDAARGSANVPALAVSESHGAEALYRPDPSAVARLLLMAMLWLTLTGSLGMLLQTVVRERASRSLESLLAVATPWQIMIGKLLGVGAVSLLILGAWIGSSEALATLMPPTGIAPPIFIALTRPWLVMRASIIYCLAFAFYGSVTVAVGALARDSASAQNLSRPMFILLMAAFFVALALALDGTHMAPAWLIYLPIFTPFLLLIYPPSAMSMSAQLGLFLLMAVAIVLAARFAVGQLGLKENGGKLAFRLR